MSPEEEHQLHELGRDLATAALNTWEPSCVARAFKTQPATGAIALTMQGWIDLDAIQSPLLQGDLPDVDGVKAAAAVFGCRIGPETAVEDVVNVARAMLRACEDAFAMSLTMKPKEETPGMAGEDGFGTWLTMWAFLVSQCGLSPDDALSIRVDRAYALMAATRRNEGWIVAGIPYSQRDVIQPPESSE